MKIPKTLRFLGHNIKVKLVSTKELDKANIGKGLYNLGQEIIKIDKRLSHTQKEAVLFHEISEMLAHYLDMAYEEATHHIGFGRYMDIFWAILKDNKLI